MSNIKSTIDSISRQRQVSEREIAQRSIIGVETISRFALETNDWKVVEAYNKMRSNHGSDIIYQSML
jgi:hypothetical protein